MASPDNETYQELLEQVKILEAASSAIKRLTMQLNKDRRISIESIHSQTSNQGSNADADAETVPDNSIFRFQGGQKTRALGYVNWNITHDILSENLELVQVIEIRKALKKLKNISPKPLNNSQQVAIFNSMSHNDANKVGNGLFTFDYTLIDKEYRFPQDAVYVNIKSPRIQEEIVFLAKLFVPPTDGVIDRFLKIVESEMHTCGSFEEQYGLKWV